MKCNTCLSCQIASFAYFAHSIPSDRRFHFNSVALVSLSVVFFFLYFAEMFSLANAESFRQVKLLLRKYSIAIFRLCHSRILNCKESWTEEKREKKHHQLPHRDGIKKKMKREKNLIKNTSEFEIELIESFEHFSHGCCVSLSGKYTQKTIRFRYDFDSNERRSPLKRHIKQLLILPLSMGTRPNECERYFYRRRWSQHCKPEYPT